MTIDIDAELNSSYQDQGRQRTSKVPTWLPGIDLGPDDGVLTTKPRQFGADSTTPDDAELLAEYNLDPAIWEVVSRRESRWQQREDGDWLQAHRVSVRRRGTGAAPLTDTDVTKILKPYLIRSRSARKKLQATGGTMLVALGDTQVGKAERKGRGTPELIDRFAELTSSVADEIKRHGRLEKLVIVWAGDCLEGQVSQGGRLALLQDLTVTAQLRLYRRLLLHQLGVLAPLAEAVVVMPVAGNHDQTTRQFTTPPTDSWALEGASAVQDALKLVPKQFGHVTFAYPAEGEISTAVNVGTEDEPFIIGGTHGHVCGSNPNSVPKWWAGQAHGDQPVGDANLLVTGHFHHLRTEFTGAGKTWLQVPSMDSGSAWYAHKTGEAAPSGMVTLELTPGQAPGWSNLRVHTWNGDAR